MATFDLLHPKVQQFIFSQKWTNFRAIQDEAIVHIIQKKDDLIICAPTASGKTEAAFLPIVSEIADDYSNSYRAVYISPLKALINDQFMRMELLCRDIGVPVTKWHGDVNQNIKLKSLFNASGILLITPESLEAMLIGRPTQVTNAFKNTRYVVIDEIHSFVGTERGAQLRSLLHRISLQAKCNPIKIALSATIGNPEEVGQWMSSKPVRIVSDPDWDKGSIEGRIRGFINPDNVTSEEASEASHRANAIVVGAIYERFTSGKNLIFGNSKKRLEETAYAVSEFAKEQNSKTQFLIHHGSLSKETKEEAESEIKSSTKPTSIFCTSTLEMGIDIGGIEKIGILDPPWSVSGFAQRVGRSGRREGTSKKFEFFINHLELNKDSNISEQLREDLVKSIAILRLYLKGFKEPLDTRRPHLSTLVHQALSFAIQRSGVKRSQMQEFMIEGPFNSALNSEEATLLIDHLIDKKILFSDSVDLILAGETGEKISAHYEFYSVFQSSDQWNVISNDQVIGQIPVIGSYHENDRILLGGRVWQVREVDERLKKLTVVPSKHAKAPIFTASFGITHSEIHKQMVEVYLGTEEYKFLTSDAIKLLAEGRDYYKKLVEKPDINSNYAGIFEGSIVQNTISCALDLNGVQHGISEICLETNRSLKEVLPKIGAFLKETKTAIRLASLLPRSKKEVEKFDKFLPDKLLDKCYAEKYLNLDDSIKWIQKFFL